MMRKAFYVCWHAWHLSPMSGHIVFWTLTSHLFVKKVDFLGPPLKKCNFFGQFCEFLNICYIKWWEKNSTSADMHEIRRRCLRHLVYWTMDINIKLVCKKNSLFSVTLPQSFVNISGSRVFPEITHVGISRSRMGL